MNRRRSIPKQCSDETLMHIYQTKNKTKIFQTAMSQRLNHNKRYLKLPAKVRSLQGKIIFNARQRQTSELNQKLVSEVYIAANPKVPVSRQTSRAHTNLHNSNDPT